MRVPQYTRITMQAVGETPPATPNIPPADPPAPAASPPGWLAQLPQDLRTNETLTGFQTIGDLAGDYLTAKGKLTEFDGRVAKMIPRLPEKPTEDDLKAYRAAMGIPEAPDKYELKRPEWPEKLGAYPEQTEKAFKEWAHNNHMTPAQVQGAYDWYMSNIVQAAGNVEQMAEQRRATATQELQKMWGDEFKANAEIATKAFWFFADQDTMQWFDKSGLGDNPAIIKLFHNIGLQLMDDRMLRDVKPPGPANSGQPVDAYGRPRISYPSMEKK